MPFRHVAAGAFLLVVGAAPACGGKVIGEEGGGQGAGSSSGGAAGSGRGSEGASGRSAGFAGGSGEGGGSGSAGSGYGGSGAATSGYGGAGSSSGGTTTCGVDLFGTMVVPTFQTCWDCAEMGCAPLLDQCSGDCRCTDAVLNALECIDKGGLPIECFGQQVNALASDDPALDAFTQCLVTAGNECGCTDTPGGGSSGASSGGGSSGSSCSPTSGGGSEGSGQCSSSFGETCGSASYEVVCECPRATCVCFGDTTTVVPFSGCPYCPGLGPASPSTNATEAKLMAACGFPQ